MQFHMNARETNEDHVKKRRTAKEDAPRDIRMLPIQLLEDAPKAWNFYKPLPDGKYIELMQSIEKNGILQPLIVWENDQGRYVILSGHNRLRAIRHLLEYTKDARYETVPCVVYERHELSEARAREIIIDCNWVQRTLTAIEKAKSIYHKYIQMGRLRRGEGNGLRRYDLIASQFHLKSAQVYQYYKIATLEEEWLNRLDAGQLSVRALVKLTHFSPEQRAALAALPKLTTKDMALIEPFQTNEEMISSLRQRKDQRLKELCIMVPSNRYQEISELVEAMLDE